MIKKLKNVDNEYVNIEIIRFFINNNIEYIIYSLNEDCEQGYVRLYAAKIIGSKACIISDEEEWHIIREIIKQIIRNNRNGIELEIIDLDEKGLDDIILQDAVVFKLQGNLVNLLSDNKQKKKLQAEITEEVVEEDYEELYKDLLNKTKILENEIENLKKEIELKTDVIEKIKEIVG